MKKILSNYHGGRQSSVTRIVIHGTVSPCQAGGAVAVARYFQSPGAGGSAHYVVDPYEIVQCVDERAVAYHAPPNTNTIGVELCDLQKGASARWGDVNHEAMLQRAAVLVREVAARWGVPLKKLTVAQVKAGAHGICGHVDVSKAFGQTDHSDPGVGFPWAHFMDLVVGDSVPSPPPAKPPKPEKSGTAPAFPGRLLAYPPVTSGADVYAWQARMRDRGWDLIPDSCYGPLSKDMCRQFQTDSTEHGWPLDADGVVGPATWKAAWERPVT